MPNAALDPNALKDQIVALLDRLSVTELPKVLSYIKSLPHRPEGIPTQELIAFFEKHHVSPEEGEEMARILEEKQ